MDILKRRLRFTEHDDLTLLREVLGQNPFENSNVWQVIKEHMLSLTGKNFTIRTLKEHLDRLIRLWLEQYKILKDKSGIEVDYTEKDILCNNIHDLMKEYKLDKKTTHTRNVSQECQRKLGIDARNSWTLSFAENNRNNSNSVCTSIIANDNGRIGLGMDEVPPEEEIILQIIEGDQQQAEETDIHIDSEYASLPNSTENNSAQTKQTSTLTSTTPTSILGRVRSTKRKINTQRQGLSYLEQFDQKHHEIKRKELEIKGKKLTIEERKITLMEKEFLLKEFEVKKQYELQEQKIKCEIEDRKNVTSIVERQDKLINLLILKMTD